MADGGSVRIRIEADDGPLQQALAGVEGRFGEALAAAQAQAGAAASAMTAAKAQAEGVAAVAREGAAALAGVGESAGAGFYSGLNG